MGALDGTPLGMVTTKGTGDSTSAVVASMVKTGETNGGSTRGDDLPPGAPISYSIGLHLANNFIGLGACSRC